MTSVILIQSLNVSLVFCCRSSDSDGAFETPESTTPVKAVSPTEPQIQQLTFDEKGTATELCHDVCLALIRHDALLHCRKEGGERKSCCTT